jgi:hypothetical protein
MFNNPTCSILLILLNGKNNLPLIAHNFEKPVLKRWPLGSCSVKGQIAGLITKLSVPQHYSLHGMMLNTADRFRYEKWAAHTGKQI